MTGREAVLKLKVKVNQLDTASNRTVRPEKALLFLNDAYESLSKAKYKKSNPNDETAFQFNQLATDELNHLSRVYEATPVIVGDEASVPVNTIEDYWVHLKSSIQVKVGNVTRWISDPNYCTLDTLGTIKNDPFNNSVASKPVVFFEENKIKILLNNFEVLKHKISYFCIPPKITLDSELSIPFLDEIIDTAAAYMLENWGDPRVQSKLSVDDAIDNK